MITTNGLTNWTIAVSSMRVFKSDEIIADLKWLIGRLLEKEMIIVSGIGYLLTCLSQFQAQYLRYALQSIF